MRDPARIDIFCKKLKQYWKQVPDWRFGQLMCNIQRMLDSDLFYTEDDELLKALDEIFAKEPDTEK